MKNKQQILSKKKHRLYIMRNSGEKDPVWKLSQDELDYIHNLGFRTTPWVYEINTQTFKNAKNLPGILKSLHSARCTGKKTIAQQLKKDELKILEEHNVRFRPLKYRIHLHACAC